MHNRCSATSREPRLGLSDDARARRADRARSTTSCTWPRSTTSTADDDASIAANVDGTRHVVELAARDRAPAACTTCRRSRSPATTRAGSPRRCSTPASGCSPPTTATKFESERLVRTQDGGAVAGVPAGGRGRRLADRRDGQDRRAVLLLPRAQPRLSPAAERCRVAVPGPRRHQHRAGRLRGRRDGRTWSPSPAWTAGRSTWSTPSRSRRAGVQRVRPRPPARRSSPSSSAARLAEPRCVGLVKLAEHVPGVTIARDAVLDRLGIPPVAADHADLRSRSSTRPRPARRSPAPAIDVPPLRGLRRRAVAVLARAPRPVPRPPARAARRAGRPARGDHRRVVGHRAGDRAEGRRGRRRAAAGGAPAADELEEVRAEIAAAGGQAYVYPCDLTDDESVREDRRADAGRAAGHRHAGQQRRPVDPPVGAAVLRPDPRLRARDGDQLLRRGAADPRAAAAHDRAAVRAHRERVVDRRAGHRAAVLGVRGVEGRAGLLLRDRRHRDARRRDHVHHRAHAAGAHADDPADQDLRRVPDQVARSRRRTW